LLSGSKKHRIRHRPVVLALLLVLLPATERAGSVLKQGRTLSGAIYFTNNTPPDKASFPVELFTTNQKKRVAAADSYDGSSFKFTAVKPGKYLLKITWPGSCVLWYRVDLRIGSQTGVRVIMDLDCEHFNGKIQNFTEN
jgi:hypothetical protein